jgi:hypothetical protein
MEKTGFKVEKTFQIVNDGDTSMTLGSVAAYGNPDAGMTFSVNNPSTISEQSAGTATLTITIPVSAPEGEHHGKLRIDAGKAGSQTITVSVVVKHEVKFEMSSYNPDFGRVDVLKSVPLEITLSEALGYKDITSVKIVRDESQPGDPWGNRGWQDILLAPPPHTQCRERDHRAEGDRNTDRYRSDEGCIADHSGIRKPGCIKYRRQGSRNAVRKRREC